MNLEDFFTGHRIEEYGVVSVAALDLPFSDQVKTLFPNCKSIIVFGVSLAKEAFSLDKKLLTCYFGEFSRKVEKITDELSNSLAEEGFFSIPLSLHAPLKIKDSKITGVLPLKYLGLQAGLGSIGLNSILISPKKGNRMMLSCVMTAKRCDPTPRLSRETCPRCGKCLDACPTKAIGGSGAVDLKKCLNIKAFFPIPLLPFLYQILGCKSLTKYLELAISTVAGHAEPVCCKCITACPFFDR